MSRTEYNCSPIGRPKGLAISRGILFHAAANAAVATVVSRKALREIFFICNALVYSLLTSHSVSVLSSNRLCASIPGRNRVLEISIIGQMAADCRVVAEVFVLDRRLAA